MFDSAQAFDRYRLEVVKSWPDGEAKKAALVAIESSLRKHRQVVQLVQQQVGDINGSQLPKSNSRSAV